MTIDKLKARIAVLESSMEDARNYLKSEWDIVIEENSNVREEVTKLGDKARKKLAELESRRELLEEKLMDVLEAL